MTHWRGAPTEYDKLDNMELYWLKQGSEPLFPDLLWSRPEIRHLAGKLLIIGGNDHAFSAPAQAYALAPAAGIGTCKVVLPVSTRKLVKLPIPDLEYTPATPSGSFSQKSLGEWLSYANWADAVLVAGDLGRNSETAILLEQFAAKSPQPLVLTRDAVDYFLKNPLPVAQRPGTTLVLSLAQLQKIGMSLNFPSPVTYDMDFMKLVAWLHDFTVQYPVQIIVKHHLNILVAAGGRVSTTRLTEDQAVWRLNVAVHASVWWLQNLSRPFEALTTAVHHTYAASGDGETDAA